MPARVLHLLARLVAGSLFGVQTLVVLALAVSVEGVASFILHGARPAWSGCWRARSPSKSVISEAYTCAAFCSESALLSLRSQADNRREIMPAALRGAWSPWPPARRYGYPLWIIVLRAYRFEIAGIDLGNQALCKDFVVPPRRMVSSGEGRPERRLTGENEADVPLDHVAEFRLAHGRSGTKSNIKSYGKQAQFVWRSIV